MVNDIIFSICLLAIPRVKSIYSYKKKIVIIFRKKIASNTQHSKTRKRRVMSGARLGENGRFPYAMLRHLEGDLPGRQIEAHGATDGDLRRTSCGLEHLYALH